MFAALTPFSLIRVLFMRGGKSVLPAKVGKRE
jgi:hypothetical protein